MLCKVRLPSRRGGWRSRERGAVGRRAAVMGVHDALDQVVSKEIKWLFGCLVCAAWWSLAFVLSRSAYAAPSVEIDGNFAGYENNETYNGYVVVDAPNEYIATLTLIGEYSSLPQIDSDMYAKLSNESSGGRFYELVQEWQVMGTNASGTAGNYPTWAGSTYFIDGLNTVYGYGHVWECAITDDLKSGAKQDFLTILDGGSIGGDSGSTVTDSFNFDMGDYIGIPVTNINSCYYLNSSNSKETLNVSGNVKLSTAAINWLNTYSDRYEHLYIYIFVSNGAAYNKGLNYNLVLSNETYKKTNNDIQIRNSIEYSNLYTSNTTVNGPNQLTSSGGSQDNSSHMAWYFYTNQLSWFVDGDTAGNPPEPGDNNWPDDDTPTPPSDNPPTPPTINPPSSPNPPTITPHNPTVPNPPTNTTPPSGTTPTDYTPWLQAILQQLVNMTSYLETCFTWLGTALDDHCQHIRDHMTMCSQFLGDYVVGGMSSLLSEHHTFLNGLAQWIVDNLKWENSGGEFDDSNMIYWLRRIYARQGAGDVNSRPVDPATDYNGFSGWLGVLYDAVALDVSDTSLTALTSSMSGLQHTFPFSLPWDVKQVLQALDVSPVTPSASIPSGTSGVSYNVDLHWMDSAMVSVRAFELLVFIVYVMVHTKDLFGYLMGE